MDISHSAIDFVLKNEGGFTIDNGGHTNFGITQKFLNGRGINKKVEDIKEVDARELYSELFSEYGCNLIQNSDLSIRFFDTCVNSGPQESVKLLQSAYNNYIGREELNIDGILGPLTISSINSADDEAKLLSYFKSRRLQFYNSLIVANPDKYCRDADGWRERAEL